jgi:NADP-dependent 3-hydroxy acid dehydrogenase YdfG
MKRLDGKVAIVTGAGTGIGRAAAKMLAAEGAAVVVNGRRQGPIDAVVKEIEKDGGRAVAKSADVADAKAGRELAAWATKTLGRVDILVNNAGFSSRVRNVRWLAQEDWDKVMAVNLTGIYALTQAVLDQMIERRSGTIITVSSYAALRPGLISGPPYGAAKAGVRNFMQFVHNVYRQHGIRATTIMPAEVDTEILDNRPHNPDAVARSTMMQPEDVAAAILLCATLPERTVIEEMVISPTIQRDNSKDIEIARRHGAPAGTDRY